MATISPDDIDWVVTDVLLGTGRQCPACGSTTPAQPVLRVPALVPPHVLLTLLRCMNGQSVFYDPPNIGEFIEHVPDPGDFAKLLSGYVADDGVLILTTPSAEFITKQNHSTTLLAALFPGFHGFLLSHEAFARMAKDAGFTHVEARTFNERQILWASRVPLRLTLDHRSLRVSLFRF